MRSPRLGFLGVGWIGAMRLDAVDQAGAAEIAAICDHDHDRLRELGDRFPHASLHGAAEPLLSDASLDGLVVATPNSFHAPQALAALERGLPLFVQKPLGLDPVEVEQVLERARRYDLPVGVDYTYRKLGGAETLRDAVRAGRLGRVHLVEATFHNAYGPDKSWCFDPAISGGGALLDLGVHLLDLVFWILGPSNARRVEGRSLGVDGRPGIDGFTTAEMILEPETLLRLTCSWHAHAGRDCEFRLVLHGTEGGAELRNVDGSFYDFELVLRRGRTEETMDRESRGWMDRGVLEWIDAVREGAGFDPSLETNLAVARVVDRIYAGSRCGSPRSRGAAPQPAAVHAVPSSPDRRSS